MSPELSRRVGRALGEHWVSFDERDIVVRAVDTAHEWSDLSADVQRLITKIESRPLVADGGLFPGVLPGLATGGETA